MKPKSSTSIVVLAVLASALASACSFDHQPRGGEIAFDAAAPSRVATAPLSPNTEHTFTSLYNDYFGPMGMASCTSEGKCHGSSDEAGSQASLYICSDKQTCYDTLTSDRARLVTHDVDPTQSGLYLILRKNGGGRMPKRPDLTVFADADLKRITDWIGGGAPND